MKEFQLPQRLNNLHTALEQCSQIDLLSDGKNKVFTIGERIAINQERGSIFSQIAHENGEITMLEVRTYKVPPHIENKIKFTLSKITN
ncbi:hypothetical protein SGQ83_01255 [Flavobacterium sp. Fl-318]|jgi:hypothetical protein|uniref:Uncharacterized protein n=1 Tax=Flavobacterium cupriresistens TaxID=2893885 RepID=A0ABU4R827_9FLAO|nr:MULTISPECIES: hypothetical protein [unclassified Flavobacterium]MDX6187963.1 hypothetical protein [Flavobacterium sp. Fl-318]UFH42117.1 hypothetical protein LNP23_20195 [Flavobacterium sp. F-323]